MQSLVLLSALYRSRQNFALSHLTIYIRKEFNSHRIFLVNQHGRRFIFLDTNMAAVTSCEYALFQVRPQPIVNFLCMIMIRKSLGTPNCHGSLVLWSKGLHRIRGRPAPIQNGSLIGQLARTIQIFHGKIVMCPLLTISHPNETQFHSLVQPSNFWDPLRQFIILCAYLLCHQNRCCVP